MPTPDGEQKYYPTVRKWLCGEGFYCGGFMQYGVGPKKDETRYFENTGSASLRVDVVGVRGVGNEVVDGVQVAAVEVKHGSHVQRSSLVQAYGYSAFADWSYLAVTSKPSAPLQEEARALGVGILLIEGIRKGCRVLVPAARLSPLAHEKLRLLEKLWIGQCTLCKVYMLLIDKPEKTFVRLDRSRMIPACTELVKVGDPDGELWEKTKHSPSRLKQEWKVRRYLCRQCAQMLKLLD